MIAAAMLSLILSQAAIVAAPEWGSSRYRECVAAAETDADAAYEAAMAWANETSDLEAFRCAGVALIESGRYEQGARRLESLGTAAEGHDALTRAGLFSQAGHAYLLANDAAHARAAFSRAIASIGNDSANLPDALIDRSLAYSAEGDFRRAEEDLSRALDLRANDSLALRLRAMARMRQNALDLALADAERAVMLDSRNVEAALVLGHVRETRRLGRQFDADPE